MATTSSDELAPGIASLAGPVQAGVEEATALLQDIRAGKGTVGKLMTDDALYREFNALLGAAEGLVAGINQGQGTLGKLARDEAAYRELNASLANLNAMTGRIRAGEGSLGRLLNDDAMAKSLAPDQQQPGAAHLEAEPRRGHGRQAAHRRRDLRAAERHDRPDRQADRQRSQQGQGTAGQLLHGQTVV